MDSLTDNEKEVLAAALTDYREGIEKSELEQEQPQAFHAVLDMVDSIEFKLGI